MPRRPGFTPLRWVLIACALAMALVGAVAAYALTRPMVTTTRVIEGPVVEAFYATGTLQPVREYPIRATGAGIVRMPQGVRSYVDRGDRVMAGQPLAVVADAQWQSAYDKSRAELDEKLKRAEDPASPVLQEFDAKVSGTIDQLQIARREERRVLSLLEEGGSSQSELDQAINRVKQMAMESESFKAQKLAMKLQLQRELEQARAAVKAAEWNVEQQTLRSPVDGVVLDLPVPLGTRLGVNDHVMQVADVRPDQLVMRAQVDEEDITHVWAGQTVRMVLYAFPAGAKPRARPASGPATPQAAGANGPVDDSAVDNSKADDSPAGGSFVGRVTKIYDKADPDRRTFEVDVAPVRPDPSLRAGMTGELAFEIQSKPNAVIVPSQAVQDGRVYGIHQGRLRGVEPVLGLKGVERTEVLAGVSPGDVILLSPAAGLREGQFVREQYLDPQVAAALNKPKAKALFRGGF